VARRDKSLCRRRRRVAAGVLVVVVAGGSLAIEGALGDESVGPDPAEIEKTALSDVPDSALLAQKLMVRMDGTATPALIRQSREGEIGGVIVFPPPGQPPDELRAQIERLQDAARGGDRPPLLVAIDQEGGEVKRLPEAPPERSPAELAAPGDERAARVAGRETGRYLARLGINVDLAPVLDVPSSPSSFIAARAFGTDPRVVAANGTAFAEGLQAGGVISAVKHFPGLGKAVANTDLEPSEIESREAALGEDLAPFREAIARDVRMVMVGLATYTSIDPEAPAGLSEAIVEGLLRRALGFDGVVISDDLGAGAVQAVASEREAPVSAARAGIDILLFAKTADGGPTREALLDALRSGELSRDELERSLVRILALKGGL